MEKFITQDLLFIAICIFIGTIAVFFIHWLLNRSPLSPWFTASEDIVASFISVPAFLFGLTVSTFAANTIQNHNIAKTSLLNEVTSVRTLLRISRTLPAEDQVKLTTAVDNYVNSIIKIEWPLMIEGKTNDFNNSIPLDNLTVLSEHLSSKNYGNRLTGDRIESAIQNLHRERLERFFLAHDIGSFAKSPSIFTLSLLMLLTIGLLQLRKPQAMKIALVMGTLCIGTSMVFIFLNISPYRGPISIQPSLLEKAIKY
jgi:hypothetical protein